MVTIGVDVLIDNRTNNRIKAKPLFDHDIYNQLGSRRVNDTDGRRDEEMSKRMKG